MDTTNEKKILTAQIAAAYLGCRVLYDYGHPNSDKKSTLSSSVDGYFLAEFNDLCKSNYRLVLRPLPEISDEDAIEICKIAGNNRSDNIYKAKQGKDLVNQYWNRQTNLSARYWIRIFDYLRSRGYDCGHGEIVSLIDAGIAVKQA